jgi:hypothetical protein
MPLKTDGEDEAATWRLNPFLAPMQLVGLWLGDEPLTPERVRG